MSTTDPTDLTGYDIVMAVTQDALNAALQYSAFWSRPINYNLSLNPLPPTAPLDPSTPVSECDGLFNTYMIPPLLSLVMPDGATNTNQVAVTLGFSSGTLQYFIRSGGEQYLDLSGWKITFRVDIALADVPGNADWSSYPKEVQEALSNPSLSVKQLFLNLMELDWTSAKFIDASGQEIKDTAITITFQQSLEGYFRSLGAQAREAVLSWLQSAPGSGQNPSYVPHTALPEFVPTTYKFSVSPYRPADTDDGLSTLNYLMMTQNRPAPGSSSAGLFDSNWVPAPNSNDSQGTICIRKALFDSAYVQNSLLPAIASIIGAPYADIQSAGTDKWTLSKSISLYTDQNDGEGKKIQNNLVMDIYETIDESVSCTVQLSAHATPNPTFGVSGTYTGAMHIIGDSLVSKWKYTATYTQNWSFQIRLKAGSDGTIVAEPVQDSQGNIVTCDEPTQDVSGDNVLGSISAALDSLIGGLTDTFAGNFQKQAQSLVAQNFSAITTGLTGAMDSISSFIVFPGGRNYAYKSLTFSTGGEENLLSSITIKN